MAHAHEKVAQAILREIPVASLDRFLTDFRSPNAVANGSGCGNGCGAGCLDGTGLTFDRFGQSGISRRELESAHKDLSALKGALRAEVVKAIAD
jgi:hypothetical protein